MNWTEREIGRCLARGVFASKALVLVPECSWPGSECDVLVVTTDLRVVEVEVKSSRADLRADARKDKWFHARNWHDGPGVTRQPREWPRRVWKHYYAMPETLWVPGIMDGMPAASGVLLGRPSPDGGLYLRCERRAKPCRDAERLTTEQALDVARLANLRMWDAYTEIRRLSERPRA